MIRATMQSTSGRRVILLGLEEGNVDRLRAGKPMHIHCDDMGFAGEIVIILGKDVEALHAMVKPMLSPDTIINDERKNKRQ